MVHRLSKQGERIWLTFFGSQRMIRPSETTADISATDSSSEEDL